MADDGLSVLIIGGYGTFGGRLARLLADEPRLTLLIGGRSPDKAERFCAAFGSARMVPILFDRDGDVDTQIARLAPDIVVDASGPFQAYGARPYEVAEAALAAGAHYLDLADGGDFVAGIGVLDGAAKTAGRFVLAGVSTYPALSGAVIRDLAHDLAHIDAVESGLTPSPFAGVGPSVIRAIAGYAGRPIAVRRGGRTEARAALIDARTRSITVPGEIPLGPVRLTLIDVPDLRLVPQRWSEIGDLWAGVGSRPGVLHRLLSLAAWSVRLGLARSLAPLAAAMSWASTTFRWGDDRGGMYLALRGRTAGGAAVSRSWHLIAEGSAGPFIPSMGAAIIVRRCLAGAPPMPGARAADGALALADFAPLFAERGIVSGVVDRAAPPDGATPPLYPDLLGPAYGRLDGKVQAFHRTVSGRRLAGRATVARGAGPIAWLAARFLRLPPAGDDVPVAVEVVVADGVETWRRRFGDHRFASTQERGMGRYAGLAIERFGSIALAFAVRVRDGRLELHLRRWRLWGLRLPLWLGPRIVAQESGGDGRFHFDVRAALPLVGPVIHYRGWLAVEDGP